MYLLTAAESQKAEKLATKRLNISTFRLMQKAGEGIYHEAIKSLGNQTNAKITVVCGSGNNGGDGLVAARYLLRKDIDVSVFSCSQISKWKGDALSAYNVLKQSYPSLAIYELVNKVNWPLLESAIRRSSLIIDAIFGSGLSRPVEGLEKEIIDAINKVNKKVISVDIPSGIHSDTGQIMNTAINASTTLSIGAIKAGSMIYPGNSHSGNINIIDIGIEKSEIESVCKINTIEQSEAKELLPKRPVNVHKKSIGRVAVIAGSSGMTGAAALCCESALRAGAGIVTLFTPKSLLPIFENKLTEIIKVPLPESNAGAIPLHAYNQLEPMFDDFDVIIIGPGLSRRPETVSFARKLVESCPLPLVIDADGINALEGQKAVLSNRSNKTIITPHPGEFSRLSGISTEDVLSDPIKCARDLSKDTKSVIVLKIPNTIVTDNNGNVSICRMGNPGMASAGTGDVLTGLIGGLWAQILSQSSNSDDNDTFSAAKLGVYIHGKAGDIAANQLSEYCLVASDIIKFLPNVFKDLK